MWETIELIWRASNVPIFTAGQALIAAALCGILSLYDFLKRRRYFNLGKEIKRLQKERDRLSDTVATRALLIGGGAARDLRRSSSATSVKVTNGGAVGADIKPGGDSNRPSD